jgi:hypothetical protein
MDAAVEAASRGATNASLIYALMLAEIDVALKRWRVAMSITPVTK